MIRCLLRFQLTLIKFQDSRFNTMGGEFISKDPNWSLVPKQKDVDSSIDKADTVETEEEQSENTSKDEV